MNDYWRSHFDAISKQFDGALLKQVGKTVNGREISERQVQAIIEGIANVLQLSAEDTLVDLCCGNGLITRQLASRVRRVIGVDFTPGLIETAKRNNSSPNIEYINSDVLGLAPQSFLGLKKVVMYEALQHFSCEGFSKLLYGLCNLEAGSRVFIGSIPNKENLNVYYDTEEKYAFYMQREREGRPHIGRWWLMEEIEQLVPACNFKITFLPQKPTLYTAYYRFDVLLERCQ